MTPPIANSTAHLLDEARNAVRRLRSSLIEVMATVGADPTSPQEVARRFSLDKTLTWKIARVVRDGDMTSAIEHVPGRRRMSALLGAMSTAGASELSVAAVWKAFDEFERLVSDHSGDRGTLDVMVASESDQALERRLEAHRRNAFLANAAIWGIRAKVHMGIHMMAPCEVPGVAESLSMCGFIGFQRLRANTPWAVANAIAFGTLEHHDSPVPLHPDGLINGGPILPAFSSTPLPEMRTVTIAGTNRRYELAPGPVGPSHAVDVVLGWRWPRDFPMHQSVPDEIGEHSVILSTPVETAILDLWIHRSMSFAMNPVARVYSQLPSGPKYPLEGRDVGRLPMPDTVTDLGTGPAGATCPEYPRAAELLHFAADRMKWSLDEFRGFRFRLRHPPIPASAWLQHALLPMRPPVR